jgi:hypothetical protein
MGVVFVSHTSGDDSWADQVASWLNLRGFACVFADHDPREGIHPSNRWVDQLLGRLQRCEAMVVIHSAAWAASQWCFTEVAFASSRGVPLFVASTDETDPTQCSASAMLRPLAPTALNAIHLKDGERALLRLSEAISASIDPCAVADRDRSRHPFPGLEPFNLADAAMFHGRQMETTQATALIGRLRSSGRLGLLLGPSGSGKSSLLQAGVAYRAIHDPHTPGRFASRCDPAPTHSAS